MAVSFASATHIFSPSSYASSSSLHNQSVPLPFISKTITSPKRRQLLKTPIHVASPAITPATIPEDGAEDEELLIETADSEEISSSKFSWRDHWYPVSLVEDLDPRYPTPFQLLNRDLVIWFDKSAAQWVAFDDKCPHRLAPLSEGRIDENGSVHITDGRLTDVAHVLGYRRQLSKVPSLVRLNRRGHVLPGFQPWFLKAFSLFGLVRMTGKELKPRSLQCYLMILISPSFRR